MKQSQDAKPQPTPARPVREPQQTQKVAATPAVSTYFPRSLNTSDQYLLFRQRFRGR